MITLRSAPDERGAVSVEAALLVPVFLLVALAVTASWRVWQTGADVQAAAEAAARAASMGRSVDAASSAARRVVAAELDRSHCRGTAVDVHAAALSAPAGSPGMVEVQVGCHVDLADLGLAWLPGSRWVEARAKAPVDRYEERS